MILDHAGRLLLRDGYQNLNLDELAKAIEYSKGTIYLHFETKEDLVLAIATRIARHRADLFERGSRSSPARPGSECAPSDLPVVSSPLCTGIISALKLKSQSFWEKASEEHRRLHGVQAGECSTSSTPSLKRG